MILIIEYSMNANDGSYINWFYDKNCNCTKFVKIRWTMIIIVVDGIVNDDCCYTAHLVLMIFAIDDKLW